jgi:hypothetical protein
VRQSDDMAEARARQAFRALAIAAVGRVQASGQGLATFRGIALYDTAKDAAFTSLDAFGAAETAAACLPLVKERYGVVEARRCTLQFAYEFLARVSEPASRRTFSKGFGTTSSANSRNRSGSIGQLRTCDI